jgi:hypothetical protein
VRTDFVYLHSGPTPEQLKLISSVESVSKFGVPYGPDAVAYALAWSISTGHPPNSRSDHLLTGCLVQVPVYVPHPRSAECLKTTNMPESRND